VSAVGRGPALVADWKDMKMTPFRSSPAPGVPPGVFGNAAAAAQPVVRAIRFAVAAAAAACATATKGAKGIGAHDRLIRRKRVTRETGVSSRLRSKVHLNFALGSQDDFVYV